MPLNSTVRLVHRRGSAVTHATASTVRCVIATVAALTPHLKHSAVLNT